MDSRQAHPRRGTFQLPHSFPDFLPHPRRKKRLLISLNMAHGRAPPANGRTTAPSPASTAARHSRTKNFWQTLKIWRLQLLWPKVLRRATRPCRPAHPYRIALPRKAGTAPSAVRQIRGNSVKAVAQKDRRALQEKAGMQQSSLEERA